MATTPTYDEGIVRGRREEGARQELLRLVDVFQRDQKTVETYRLIVHNISFGLGNVAADGSDRVRDLARELTSELAKTEQCFGDRVGAYRSELAKLK